ncbi:MAG: murein biosynthesis integral membrane protein MurJ [Planctomycetota bacterium]
MAEQVEAQSASAPAGGAEGSEREHFFGAAKVVAGLTMCSRVLGLVREVALTALGATAAMDAYRVAFSIPHLFRRLFGEGATSASFVPVFTEVLQTDGEQRARQVLANATGWLALVLLLVAGLVEGGIGVWLLVGSPAHYDALLGQLVMIMLPFMITVCLLALTSAALNCRGHFAYPAFAPVLLNVFQITAAATVYALGWGDSRKSLVLLSCAVVAAGVVQLALAVLLLRRHRLTAWPTLRPLLPEVRKIASLTAGMLVPLGVLQFSAFYDRFYAFAMAATPADPTVSLFGLILRKPLQPGVVTWFDNANRLYQLPLGILAISLATAVFPLFSRYAAANDTQGLRSAVNRALRLSFFMGIPAGVGLILLARPIITVIFLRGQYTPADAASAAYILRMYSIGMWAFFANHILLRAFFAQKDTRTPLRVAALLTIGNVLLVTGLVWTPLREGALGLATAATSSINMLLLTYILRRRWGRLGLGRIVRSVARTAIATAAMGGVIVVLAWAIRTWLEPAETGVMIRAGALTVGGVLGGAGTFIGVARLLGAPEIGELLGRGKAAEG